MKKRKDHSHKYAISKTDKQRLIERKCSMIIDLIINLKFMKLFKKPLTSFKYAINDAIITPKQIYKMWKKFANQIEGKHSKLKIFLTILLLTIEDCVIIYFKVIFYLLFWLFFTSFIIFICIYGISFIVKKVIIHIPNLCKNVLKDTWITFAGNIFCGIMTICGIAITLKFERKRDRLNNIQQTKPIIIIYQDEKNINIKSENIPSCHIDFQYIESKNDQTIEINCPYLILENIGFNLALNINMFIHMRHMSSASYSDIKPIDIKEKIPYIASISFEPDNLKDFDRVLVKQNMESWFHGDILRSSMVLGIDMDEMELVASDPGIIKLEYQDVNGIKYEQTHESRLYITKTNDAYYACIICQNYAINEICKK